MSLTQLGTNSPEGTVAPGIHKEVIQSIGTTERQLVPSESGSLILLDAATQITVRLPTPVAGMTFEFQTTVTVTASDTHKIITKTIASEFMIGGIGSFNTTLASGGDSFDANGSTHVAATSNGSTSGGLVGQLLKFTAISTTQWAVSGHTVGTGTSITPFATS
tara:strand:- start:9686 stop:10174 length:489 start_codon:yes stop_codon:yes gene_type:complete